MGGLVLRAEREDCCLIMAPADDLETDRQPAASYAGIWVMA
jgi:hypothetical protein